jgi:hypothetical protein
MFIVLVFIHYKSYFYTYILINMNTIYIYIHAHTSELTIRVELIQAELMSFVRVEPNLYGYVSFNIRADYFVHE